MKVRLRDILIDIDSERVRIRSTFYCRQCRASGDGKVPTSLIKDLDDEIRSLFALPF